MNEFRSWYFTLPTAFRAILTINVGFFLVYQLLLRHIAPVDAFIDTYLALQINGWDWVGRPWTLVTYNFLHTWVGLSGLLHMVFNMLWLYWIGQEYEDLFGPGHLLAAYLLSGILGGVLSGVVHALVGQPVVIVGASASVLGVLALMATRYPYKSIMLFLLGNVRLPILVLGFLALDVLFLGSSSTAVFAHLGGALGGYLIAKASLKGIDVSSWANVFFLSGTASWLERLELALARRKQGSRKQDNREATRTRSTAEAARSSAIGSQSETDVEDASEIDRILDKISATGYDSLTAQEKRTLLNASGKA